MDNALWALLGLGGAYLAYKLLHGPGSQMFVGGNPTADLTGTPSPLYQNASPVTFNPKADVRDHRNGQAPAYASSGNSSYYTQSSAVKTSFSAYNGAYMNGTMAHVG